MSKLRPSKKQELLEQQSVPASAPLPVERALFLEPLPTSRREGSRPLIPSSRSVFKKPIAKVADSFVDALLADEQNKSGNSK